MPATASAVLVMISSSRQSAFAISCAFLPNRTEHAPSPTNCSIVPVRPLTLRVLPPKPRKSPLNRTVKPTARSAALVIALPFEGSCGFPVAFPAGRFVAGLVAGAAGFFAFGFSASFAWSRTTCRSTSSWAAIASRCGVSVALPW